jgi:hypothetical protein
MTYSSAEFLVSLADIRDYLGMETHDDDSVIGFIAASISELFNGETRRKLKAQAVTEYRDGDGTNMLYLQSYPVQSETLYVDSQALFGSETLVPSSEYFLEASTGLIRYGNVFERGRRNIKIAYTGGYASIPYDLQLAYLEAVHTIYKRRQEKRTDVDTLARGETSYTYLQHLPYTVTDVLKRYRRLD